MPRRDWAASAPGSNYRPLGRVECLTIHHTGADTLALGASDLQTVQRIEGWHRDQRGWACIGYHFLIGDDGTVYQGRPLHMQGAHVLDHNAGNIGIACIGAFDVCLPSMAQLQSLTWLIGRIRSRTHFSPGQVFAHRDLSPSTCPGDRLYAWLQEHLHGPAFG